MPGKAFCVHALHGPLPQAQHGHVTCPPGCPWFPLWCVGSWAQGKATFLGPVLVLGSGALLYLKLVEEL